MAPSRTLRPDVVNFKQLSLFLGGATVNRHEKLTSRKKRLLNTILGK